MSLFLSFGLGYGFAKKDLVTLLNSASSSSSGGLNLNLFWEVLASIKDKYYDQTKIADQKLLFGAIKGMVASLGDPYTSFFDPSQNSSFKEELSGYYEGIGAQLGFRTIPGLPGNEPQLTVIAPLVGSPAEKAGVKGGDLIVKIDDKAASQMALADAISLIRGKEGTVIKLTLLRIDDKNKSQLIDLAITRAKIKVDSVSLEWKGKDKNTALVRVTRFGDDTQSLWDKTVAEINQKCPTSSCSVILDLRNNPGGFLETASSMAADFFKDGVTVEREFANGNIDKTQVNESGRLVDAKVVVLVNEGSASASEILAGALQDRSRAKLVGTQSFGKGTVQEVVDLNGGSSLHVTSSKWLLPSGRWINGVGLTPDFKVILSDQDIEKGIDPQLDKAMEVVNK